MHPICVLISLLIFAGGGVSIFYSSYHFSRFRDKWFEEQGKKLNFKNLTYGVRDAFFTIGLSDQLSFHQKQYYFGIKLFGLFCLIGVVFILIGQQVCLSL